MLLRPYEVRTFGEWYTAMVPFKRSDGTTGHKKVRYDAERVMTFLTEAEALLALVVHYEAGHSDRVEVAHLTVNEDGQIVRTERAHLVVNEDGKLVRQVLAVTTDH